MERFLKYCYYIFLFCLIAATIYMTAVMFAAPRKDALKRGFIPCTEKLVIDITDCKSGNIGCAAASLWNDAKCNIKVVAGGAAAWMRGEQPTPWSNYLFTPVYELYAEGEAAYGEETILDLADIEEKHILMQKKQNEFEDSKQRQYNLDEGVLIYDPENDILSSGVNATADETEMIEESGDISEEVFTENIDGINVSVAESKGNEKDILQTIKKITEQKLQQGELANEK